MEHFKPAFLLLVTLLMSQSLFSQLDFMGTWEPVPQDALSRATYCLHDDGSYYVTTLNDNGDYCLSILGDDNATQSFVFETNAIDEAGVNSFEIQGSQDILLGSSGNNMLIRFNPVTETIIWSKVYNHVELRNFRIFQAKNGRFFISGWMLPGGSGFQDDFYILEIDINTGDIIYQQRFGTTSADDQYSFLGLNVSGNLLILGSSSSIGWNGVVMEFDITTGTILRSKKFDVTTGSESFAINLVEVLPDNSYLIAGYKRNSGYNHDIVVMHISNDLETIHWIKNYDYELNGQNYDIVCNNLWTNSNKIYINLTSWINPGLPNGIISLDMNGNLLSGIDGVSAVAHNFQNGKLRVIDRNPLGEKTGMWSPELIFETTVNGGPCWNPTYFDLNNFIVNDLNDVQVDDWSLTMTSLSGFVVSDTSVPVTNTTFNYNYECQNTGIRGFIFQDLSEDCILDNNEYGLANRLAIIEPGNIIVQTNDLGYWHIDELPVGTYTITYDVPANWLNTCPITQTFDVNVQGEFLQVTPFGLKSNLECNKPVVSIFAPFMRPCRTNDRVFVSACNNTTATDTLENSIVVVDLGPMFEPTEASIPYTDLGNYQYEFQIPINLLPGECFDFWITVLSSCDLQMGETECIQAELNPVEDCVLDTIPGPGYCDLPWDKSSLLVEGYCQNDTVYFEVTNTGDFGEGDMQCFSQILLYIDGELVILDSIQLVGGETIVFAFEGNGGTYHFEADQHPLHPGNSHPNANVENCGTGTWTPNLVNIFPQDDADPVIDIYCGVVTASYDPNDKTGFPLGVGDEHLIAPNQKMEYLIRFQNTGTDTALTVVIRDTLSTDFDIFSVTPTAASHDYVFEMYGPRVLQWTFNNINLPDSTSNYDESNGFVTFTVNQNLDLAEGTIIENSAAIYFDNNPPIITNTAFHEIYYGLQNLVLSSSENIQNIKNNQFLVFPNPSTGELWIDLQNDYTNIQFELYSIDGKMLQRKEFNHTNIVSLQIEQTSGIYFAKIKTNEGHTEIHKLIIR